MLESNHSFSVEIDVQPEKGSYNYTARIFSLYDGERTENIVLSQWKSALMLQRGIMHDHPEESYPKVWIKDALLKGVKRVLTIISGPGGRTKIYFDGKLTGKYSRFHLLDSRSNFGNLILGNSPQGYLLSPSLSPDASGLTPYASESSVLSTQSFCSQSSALSPFVLSPQSSVLLFSVLSPQSSVLSTQSFFYQSSALSPFVLSPQSSALSPQSYSFHPLSRPLLNVS